MVRPIPSAMPTVAAFYNNSFKLWFRLGENYAQAALLDLTRATLARNFGWPFR